MKIVEVALELEKLRDKIPLVGRAGCEPGWDIELWEMPEYAPEGHTGFASGLTVFQKYDQSGNSTGCMFYLSELQTGAKFGVELPHPSELTTEQIKDALLKGIAAFRECLDGKGGAGSQVVQ